MVHALEGRQWGVFHRIALHLLRLFPDAVQALIAERLIERVRFDEFRHEYELLLHERFSHLLPDDQKKILDWIESGPDLNQYKVNLKQYFHQEITDEEADRFGRSWKRDRLTPIRDALPQEWRQRYDALVGELGEPQHHEQVVRTGPNSPKGTQELSSMNTVDMITYMKTWQPSEDPMGPSQEGLGRALTALVALEPERYAIDALLFQGLDPTYVRSILRGFSEAIGQSKPFPWEPVLNLCEWVVTQPISIEGRNANAWNADPNWGWTRKVIAGLLGSGVQEGAVEIPYEYKNKVWAILFLLTNDPDPTLEDESRSDGLKVEPSHLSINTTRGEAMHTVVRYGLWVRRNIEKRSDGKEALAHGFDEMPEVRLVLEGHLNPQLEQTLTIRSIYGQWFPWLVLLDRVWTIQNVSKVFSRTQELDDFWNAAWETYITFCPPYDNVLEIVLSEYVHAVDQIRIVASKRGHRENPDEHLAEHLMTFYWRGKLDFDAPDGLLARFYAKASDQLCGHAIRFVGQSLRNTKAALEPKIFERLKALWLQRVNIARETAPSLHHAELAAFGWWFASSKFDDTWAMNQLVEVLRLTGTADPDFLIVQRLVEIAEAMPVEVMKCLSVMVESSKEDFKIYGWREELHAVLGAVIQSSNNAARHSAFELVHRLGAKGHIEFRDLLPKSSPS